MVPNGASSASVIQSNRCGPWRLLSAYPNECFYIPIEGRHRPTEDRFETLMASIAAQAKRAGKLEQIVFQPNIIAPSGKETAPEFAKHFVSSGPIRAATSLGMRLAAPVLFAVRER